MSIVEGPQHLPIDSWVINHPAMFVELTMKHIGRLLNTVSALIGDAHSAGIQLQMGAVALLLDILFQKLKKVVQLDYLKMEIKSLLMLKKILLVLI